MSYSLTSRPKRLRQSATVRALVQETSLRTEQFVAPLFIYEGLSQKREIPSMPNQYQLPLTELAEEIHSLTVLGISAVLLFGIPLDKNACGSAALKDDGIIQQAIPIIKQANPQMLIITDLCFCEYTDHGHCGIIKNNPLSADFSKNFADPIEIDNNKTLILLAEQAVSHARAGAHWVAPSSMTDGMVAAIRQALDNAGFADTAILSYSVKYSSCLYGPFRDAAEGVPQFGDRKTYQMNPCNSQEALREAQLDIDEGADVIMVKPALMYLDIIHKLKQNFPATPLCAYQVSGEYSMIKLAARQGLINEQQAIVESLTAIKRAGADFIISYFAKDIARIICKKV